MTTQRRTFVRTPRKEKAWAYNRNTGLGTAVLTGVSVHLDLLATWATDLGVNVIPKCTIMRIVGTMGIGNQSDVTTAGLIDVSWGIAWVRNVVATASAGDAQIPDPEEGGARETQWLQRGVLMGTSVAGAHTRGADQGQLFSQQSVDITQMRKQPTSDYRLVLITHGTNLSDGSILGWFNLDCMVALA